MTHITATGVEAYWSIWIATVLASFTIIQIYHVEQWNKFTLDIAWCTQIPLPLQFSKLTYLCNFHHLTIRIQAYICSQILPPCSSNIHYLDDNCVSVPYIHLYLLLGNSKNALFLFMKYTGKIQLCPVTNTPTKYNYIIIRHANYLIIVQSFNMYPW